MTTIQWQTASSKNASSPNASVPASNPWFAVSIGLLGIIIGFSLGKWRIGDFPLLAGSPQDQVAQVPPTTPPSQPPAPSAPVPPIDAKKDHIRGNLSKAQVAVIEYSDMECPFCKRVHPTYQQIMKEYEDEVVWVYRHYPLSFHANAAKEAEASDCAAELGGNDAFWKYVDRIFEKTTGGGTGIALDQLVPLAKEIGLDEATFKSCLDAGTFTKHVQEEMTSGSAAGVNGTPGNFVLNLKTQKSQEVSGAQPFESFKSAIDAALKS